MKRHGSRTVLKYSSIVGIAFALSASLGHAGMNHFNSPATGKMYLGVFGGFDSSNKISVAQYGTAFYFENKGGPLAVNAFGKTNHKNVWFWGGQVGFEWADVLGPFCNVGITPAFELEGLWFANKSRSGHLVNEEDTRLPEHDFIVSYSLRNKAFLANAVLFFNTPYFAGFRPYIGAGIGGALLSITHADSLQIAPPEAGVNHYNGHTRDRAATFAGQIKLGLQYMFCNNVSVFAEYRWLYIGSSEYHFGSTVYPGHPVTANWRVKLGDQHHNMGAFGLQYNF